MKKFLTTSLLIALFLTTSIQTAFAQFTDLFKNHKNYQAITYLSEKDILIGYPDDTFRPEQEVNRAEFLKIILEGSNIPLDKNDITLPFSDTQKIKWYTPYLKKAYDSGWVIGFEDNTFKADQTIKKSEALKILGEVQQWNSNENPQETPYDDVPKSTWYAKYVVFAYNNGYLEENGDLLEPGNQMTRANISEIIYRTLEGNLDQPLIVPDYNEIPKDYFDNITLTQNLPNTFYQNEVFVIEGESFSTTDEEVTIFLDPINHSDTDYLLFTEEVENGHFEISVHFRDSGYYSIGIIPGTDGNTKIAEISVLSSLPSSSSQTEPKENVSPTIGYEADTTFVQFSNQLNSIKIITFEQSSKSVKFLSRQDIEKIPLFYPAFEDFSEGEVTYFAETAELSSRTPLELSSSYITSNPKTFQATQHTFDQIQEDKITASPPDTLSSRSKDISFSGTTKTDTQIEAYVIKPDGFVDILSLSTTSETSDYFGVEFIEEGSDFTFEYSPSQNDRYIIEVSDKNGIPIINHPVYVGGIIPLIPDYIDLHDRFFFSGSFDVDDLREDLLEQINISRDEHGLPEIEQNFELNELAQNHSDDIAENNFFGHINLEGQTPNDRRLEAGISTPVSENIAKDVSIIFAHLGLMRSGSHRENIINPDWNIVGLGITQDNGYLYIVEEFSTGEISEDELDAYKDELLSEINSLRTSNDLSSLTYSNNIEAACKYLNNKTISEGVELTEEDLTQALETYRINGTSQYIGRTYNIWSTILSSILSKEQDSILDETWVSIGIDLQLDDEGIIYTTFMLNK